MGYTRKTAQRSRPARIPAAMLAAGIVLSMAAGSPGKASAMSSLSASRGETAGSANSGCDFLDPRPLHFREYGGPRDSGTAVIRTPEALAAYWQYFAGHEEIPPELVDVEPGRLVVAAHAGTRNSGGFTLEITECSNVDHRTAIVVHLVAPTGAASRARTTPSRFWSVKDPDMPIDVTLTGSGRSPQR